MLSPNRVMVRDRAAARDERVGGCVPDRMPLLQQRVVVPERVEAEIRRGTVRVDMGEAAGDLAGLGASCIWRLTPLAARSWRRDADDPSQVGPLLDQIDDPIDRITADGAYDGAPTYQTIAAHGDGIEVVIPPRSTAAPSGEPGPPTQRDRHLAMIADQGRMAWQTATDYAQRSLVETTMGRYKLLIGPRMRARGFAAQQTEAAIGAVVLNRMLAAGRPDSVRRQPLIASGLDLGPTRPRSVECTNAGRERSSGAGRSHTPRCQRPE